MRNCVALIVILQLHELISLRLAVRQFNSAVHQLPMQAISSIIIYGRGLHIYDGAPVGRAASGAPRTKPSAPRRAALLPRLLRRLRKRAEKRVPRRALLRLLLRPLPLHLFHCLFRRRTTQPLNGAYLPHQSDTSSGTSSHVHA
jgi:hypothetical protein